MVIWSINSAKIAKIERKSAISATVLGLSLGYLGFVAILNLSKTAKLIVTVDAGLIILLLLGPDSQA